MGEVPCSGVVCIILYWLATFTGTGWQHSLEEWKVCSEKQSDVHELGVCRVTMGFERWILGAQVGDQQLSGAETQEQRLPPMKAAKVCE